MDENTSATNSHTFIGSVWCNNDFNDEVPSYAIIRFSNDSILQIAHAKTALNNPQGIGVDEIRVSPIVSIEWRKWLSLDEVDRIRAGEYKTNMDGSSLDEAIQPEEDSELESDASIRGECLCIGAFSNYLCAYEKLSEDSLEVYGLDLEFVTNSMEPNNETPTPVMEQFQYRLRTTTSTSQEVA